MLPACQPIEQELVLPIGLQATDGDLMLVCGHRYHLGLLRPILALNHKELNVLWGTVQKRPTES